MQQATLQVRRSLRLVSTTRVRLPVTDIRSRFTWRSQTSHSVHDVTLVLRVDSVFEGRVSVIGLLALFVCSVSDAAEVIHYFHCEFVVTAERT